jgi:hypothetical protein
MRFYTTLVCSKLQLDIQLFLGQNNLIEKKDKEMGLFKESLSKKNIPCRIIYLRKALLIID